MSSESWCNYALSASTDGRGELPNDGLGHLPAHTCIGDTLTIDKVGLLLQVLATVNQETFHENPDDASFAGGDLPGDLS